MPLVAQPDQRARRAVEAALEADCERVVEIAVDVQRLIEIRLEHADVTEQDRLPLRAARS